MSTLGIFKAIKTLNDKSYGRYFSGIIFDKNNNNNKKKFQILKKVASQIDT